MAELNRVCQIKEAISDAFVSLAGRFKQVSIENKHLKDEMCANRSSSNASHHRRRSSTSSPKKMKTRTGQRQSAPLSPARQSLKLTHRPSFEDVAHAKVLGRRWVDNARKKSRNRRQSQTTPARPDTADVRAQPKSRRTRSNTTPLPPPSRGRSPRKKPSPRRRSSPSRSRSRSRSRSASRSPTKPTRPQQLPLAPAAEEYQLDENWTVLNSEPVDKKRRLSMPDMSSESLDELYERMDSLQRNSDEMVKVIKTKEEVAQNITARILVLQKLQMSDLPDDVEVD